LLPTVIQYGRREVAPRDAIRVQVLAKIRRLVTRVADPLPELPSILWPRHSSSNFPPPVQPTTRGHTP
jgi:hypothetical protein